MSGRSTKCLYRLPPFLVAGELFMVGRISFFVQGMLSTHEEMINKELSTLYDG